MKILYAERVGEGVELEEVTRALPAPGPGKLAAGGALLVVSQGVMWSGETAGVTDVFALMVTALGAYLIYVGVRERLRGGSPVMRALLTNPMAIVWVYDRSAWRGSKQVGEVHVHFDDGERAVLVAPTPAGTSKLVDVFKRRVPTATFGWDSETDLKFKADPASVRARR